MREIDGRAIAAAIGAEVTARVERLAVPPRLVVVVPNDDEGAAWYVRTIERTAAKVGIECVIDHPGNDVSAALRRHSDDPAVHGIICQAPLPEGVRLEDIDPAKDVDGANPTSLGRLAAGLPTYAPATAAAVLEILRREEIPLAGKRVVVVGRSSVVGKPAALLLLAEHATVTICHSRTQDLPAVCAEADVLVLAVGRPQMVDATYVKPGAVVIDVGINPTHDGTIVGDAAAESVATRAGALTPVPGGVGPVTTMLLLSHTATAATTVAELGVSGGVTESGYLAGS